MGDAPLLRHWDVFMVLRSGTRLNDENQTLGDSDVLLHRKPRKDLYRTRSCLCSSVGSFSFSVATSCICSCADLLGRARWSNQNKKIRFPDWGSAVFSLPQQTWNFARVEPHGQYPDSNLFLSSAVDVHTSPHVHACLSLTLFRVASSFAPEQWSGL